MDRAMKKKSVKKRAKKQIDLMLAGQKSDKAVYQDLVRRGSAAIGAQDAVKC